MSATQLTLDGGEVPHPPRAKRKLRSYVVCAALGRDGLVVLGTFEADSPRNARRVARRETGTNVSPLVAVASRNWRVGG